MKPFQIYRVRKWPNLTDPLKNSTQLTLYDGCIRDLVTKISPICQKVYGGLDEFRIFHEMEEKKTGYTSILYGGAFKDVKFSKYISSSEFPAYYHEDEKIFIVNASKKICKSFRGQVGRLFKQIEIEEKKFDFNHAPKFTSEYLAAWFRNISTTVKSASLSGKSIQDDSNFEKFLTVGALSNITIPFEFEGAIHNVMLTASSAIVFVQNYKNTQMELEILMSVYRKIILPTWKLCGQET